MRILVVEDDPGIASFLRKGLGAEGHATDIVDTALVADAVLRAEGSSIGLVLLDLGLAEGDGLDVLRRHRQRGGTTPVIILTARAEVTDKVLGLDAGANDYMTKPFSFEELLARIRAVLRSEVQTEATVLTVGDLRLDLLSKVAWRANRRIDLSHREWALLELFMRHPTQVLSRAQILDQVWDYAFEPGSNVVDVYVGHLRRKVNEAGKAPLILTVRGAGYRLTAPG